MNLQTQMLRKTKNKWTKPEYFRVDDYSPLIETTVDDDSDLHQRSQCEDFRARAEFSSFQTHDAMELKRNANRRHWVGCKSKYTESRQR